jgi:hypothetical protein
MLNYSNLTYRDKPSSVTRRFEIHPLAYKGHKEYVSNESEVHYYLHKLTPAILEEIYRNPNEEQQQCRVEIPKTSFEERGEVEVPIHHEASLPKMQQIEESEFIKKNDNFSATFSKGFYSRNNNMNSLPIVTKSCKTRQVPNESRYNQQILKDVDVLKNTKYASTSHGFYRPKKYDGFESFNVPRTDVGEKYEYKSTKIYQDSISKTIYSERTDLQLDEENERLKNILQSQTNRNFLRNANLPNIRTIIEQPKFFLKKTGTGTKNMGAKYNPFNFDQGGKNRTKRNPSGALFQF